MVLYDPIWFLKVPYGPLWSLMVPYIDMLTFKLPQCSFKSLILADIESFAFLFNAKQGALSMDMINDGGKSC